MRRRLAARARLAALLAVPIARSAKTSAADDDVIPDWTGAVWDRIEDLVTEIDREERLKQPK